jgi:hypothetical protein
MASPEPPSPPPPPPPPAPTTINALTDDLLREIFLRLPDLPSLTCAAFSCRAFLRAVRSSPAFRRRFRELHAPHILALFVEPDMRAFVPAISRMSDNTGMTAVFANLLRDDGSSEWRIDSEAPYSDGYVLFVNRNTKQSVWYNVHTQALEIYPKESHAGVHDFLEFHTLPADREDQKPSRVVCVHNDRVAVFSSHAMEWRVLPEPGSPLLQGHRYTMSTVVNGFVCWLYQDCILALNTSTFQFSLVYLPPLLNSNFNIGRTKDGDLCMVDVQECKLSVWLWTADAEGVHRFMLHKTFQLHTSVEEITKRSVEDIADVGSQLIIVIDGFVYLSVVYGGGDPQSWFLSVCLETAEVNFLFKTTSCSYCFDPYIMAWPPSLIHSKVSLLLCLKLLG